MWTRQASRLMVETGRSGTVTQGSVTFSMVALFPAFTKHLIRHGLYNPHERILLHELSECQLRSTRIDDADKKAFGFAQVNQLRLGGLRNAFVSGGLAQHEGG